MSLAYYNRIYLENLFLLKTLTDFPQTRVEDCKLGFINWENSNCWLDHVILILIGVYNKDLTPDKWKVDRTNNEDVKLEEALLRLKKRLESGEKGRMSGEVKALLGKDFPKGNDWCDSYQLIPHILERLGIGKLDDRDSVTFTSETEFIRETNYDFDNDVKDFTGPILGNIVDYVKASLVKRNKKLYGLVILFGDHYYGCFLCNGNWVYYNDLRDGYINFKNYNDFYRHIDEVFGEKWFSADCFYTYPSNLERNAVIRRDDMPFKLY